MGIVKLNNPRVWRTYTGGKLINTFHNQKGEDNNYPEEWIMSLTKAINPGFRHDEGLSLIPTLDISLKKYIENDPELHLGKDFYKKNGNNTSVLVKFIDSFERLTVQVHPSKSDALKYFDSQFGKSEAWYFLEGRTIDDVAPYVYLGFKPGVTKELWKDLFLKQDIEGMLKCLNKIDVKKGDCFFIEGGIPHAIGSGCFLIEIQEPTDYTLRVEKTTPGGLVIDEKLIHQGIGYDNMFEIFNYQTFTKEELLNKYKLKPTKLDNYTTNLIGYNTTEYFRLNELKFDSSIIVNEDTFYGLVVLEGSGIINYDNVTYSYKKGNQFFISASVSKIEIIADKETTLIQAFGPKI